LTWATVTVGAFGALAAPAGAGNDAITPPVTNAAVANRARDFRSLPFMLLPSPQRCPHVPSATKLVNKAKGFFNLRFTVPPNNGLSCGWR
jgi:hypothetical protein